MKALSVVLLVVLCASIGMAQSYSQLNKAPYSRTLYGAAAFAADSHYVFAGATKWVTVTAAYDTTAGTTVGWFCTNNDSANAIPIRPGVGGNYGDGRTFKAYGLTHYRVKGAVPLTVTIE